MNTEILQSKKFQAAVLASAVAFLATYTGYSPEQVLTFIAPLLGFIGMQGISDIGKSKAEIQAVFKPGPQTITNVTDKPPNKEAL